MTLLRKQSENPDVAYVQRALLWMLGICVLLMALFYFLAGEQLHYRASRGNIEMETADMGSVELTPGASVEQIFSARIDRLERVAVQFGAYYRANSGTLTMELLRLSDGEVLLRQEYDVSTILESQNLEMITDTPIEHLAGKSMVLRITADSPQNMAVTPLLCSSAEEKTGWQLLLNGEAVAGVLSFSVSGEDYIWTGRFYWQFVFGVTMAMAVLFFVLLRRFEKGQRSYFIAALLALKKYRFLIDQLVSRDFKTRYKRSVLGMLWSLLNPLLMMMVQYIVFSTVFNSDIPNFATYLIIGVVMFNFFNEACGQALTSIIGNAGLITKVYMPKYIYPLTRTMLSMINLLISLVPLIFVCLLTGVKFQKSTLLSLYFMACLVVFTLGFGMLLATSMVFFRDTQFLWGVVSMMWMYATPVFYPEKLLLDKFAGALRLNPLYFFLKNARICILEGVSPEPREYVRCMAIALGMLLVGSFIFWRKQNKFVLYL